MSDSNVERFLSRVGDTHRSALATRSDLDALLAAHVASGRAAWPGIALDEGDFLAHLAERLPDDCAAAELLGDLHASDLWLAAACAHEIDGAALALERGFMAQLDGVLSRAGVEMRDELRQRVREKLLVPLPGKAPRIGEYTGRGPLQGWLKVVASRIAVDFLRAREPGSAGDDELLALPSEGADPELVHLRDRYREEFRLAMTEAAKGLGARARTVLRLHSHRRSDDGTDRSALPGAPAHGRPVGHRGARGTGRDDETRPAPAVRDRASRARQHPRDHAEPLRSQHSRDAEDGGPPRQGGLGSPRPPRCIDESAWPGT